MPDVALTPEDVRLRYAQALTALCEIAQADYYAGRLNTAIALLEQAQQIAEAETVAAQDRLNVLLALGDLRLTRAWLDDNAFEETFALFRRGLALAEAAHDHSNIARALDAIGFTHYFIALNGESAQYEVALNYFQQALTLHASFDDPVGCCETLFHVGLIYQQTDRPMEALEYFQSALKLAQADDLKRIRSYLLRHIGFAQQAQDDLPAALDNLQESLRLREEIGFQIFLPLSRVAVANMLNSLKRLDEAQTHYERALADARQIGLQRILMLVLNSYGGFLRTNGTLEQVRQHLQEAYNIAIKIGHRGLIENLGAYLAAPEKDT